MIGMDISLGILLVFSFIAFFGRQFFMYIRSVYSAKISKYLEMQLSKKLFINSINSVYDYCNNDCIDLREFIEFLNINIHKNL